MSREECGRILTPKDIVEEAMRYARAGAFRSVGEFMSFVIWEYLEARRLEEVREE